LFLFYKMVAEGVCVGGDGEGGGGGGLWGCGGGGGGGCTKFLSCE